MIEHRNLKVILAHDGSEHAGAAMSLLQDLPLSPGSQITIVSVYDPDKAGDQNARSGVINRAFKSFQDLGVQVETRLISGHPAEMLVEAADSMDADLILVGAKGLQSTLGIFLGGVAQQVVEYARQPVMVVRAPYQGLKHILLAQDGSEHGNLALEYLCGMQNGHRFPLPGGAEIHVSKVISSLELPGTFLQSVQIGPEFLSQQEVEAAFHQKEAEEKEARDFLDKAVEVIRAGGMKAQAVVLQGEPATELIRYASEKNIDLIVAGSRGLSRVKGWLMGSVSRKLVHYAKSSVLIVK